MDGDAGLTDRGRRQAALLEERLRDQRLRADRLYASTLPRALETAEYVSRALGLPVETDDDLQELRPGEADGLSFEEWQARFPGLENGLSASPFHPFAPGGESWAVFLVRAGAALAGIVAEHPGRDGGGGLPRGRAGGVVLPGARAGADQQAGRVRAAQHLDHALAAPDRPTRTDRSGRW